VALYPAHAYDMGDQPPYWGQAVTVKKKKKPSQCGTELDHEDQMDVKGTSVTFPQGQAPSTGCESLRLLGCLD